MSEASGIGFRAPATGPPPAPIKVDELLPNADTESYVPADTELDLTGIVGLQQFLVRRDELSANLRPHLPTQSQKTSSELPVAFLDDVNVIPQSSLFYH